MLDWKNIDDAQRRFENETEDLMQLSALELAAQTWTKPTTSHIPMNVALCKEFELTIERFRERISETEEIANEVVRLKELEEHSHLLRASLINMVEHADQIGKSVLWHCKKAREILAMG